VLRPWLAHTAAALRSSGVFAVRCGGWAVSATVLGSFMVVAASIGVVALLIFLLPFPRVARAGMCALTVMCGLIWGVDQVRLASLVEPAQLAMVRLAPGARL